jgi:hypothetical protein
MTSFESYVPGSHVANAIATIVLVLIGIWGVVETKGALEATQRAWVTPLGAQLLRQLETDQGIRVVLTFINPGREPATDVAFKFKSATIDRYNPQYQHGRYFRS